MQEWEGRDQIQAGNPRSLVVWLSAVFSRSVASGRLRTMKNNSALLDRLVDPVVRTLTPEVARGLVHLRADPELQARMDELAQKCNEGQLSPEEREEYETSIRFGNFIALLQVKTRALLKHRASP
jgi:hypothetical protein